MKLKWLLTILVMIIIIIFIAGVFFIILVKDMRLLRVSEKEHDEISSLIKPVVSISGNFKIKTILYADGLLEGYDIIVKYYDKDTKKTQIKYGGTVQGGENLEVEQYFIDKVDHIINLKLLIGIAVICVIIIIISIIKLIKSIVCRRVHNI